MLLHIDGEVVEIRPGENFTSSSVVESRYLEVIQKPTAAKKRTKSPSKTTKEKDDKG